MSFLEVRELTVAYGAIRAVRAVTFSVEQGQIVSIIGSNGAGKTTTLRTISGLLRPIAGEVLLDGEPIHRLPAHEILQRGVAHSPEGRRLFSRMTVEENLRLGAYTRNDEADIVADMDRVYELFPVLGERRRNKAGLFSGGEQQMLAIGRALMGKPRLLLLDEPSMGLAPLIVEQIFEIVRGINADGVSVLLVEQNARQALTLADRGYVLETGELVLSGSGRDLLADDRIRAAYLGEELAS
jgi:branched-chain amino acid transport system ATP-binding protein